MLLGPQSQALSQGFPTAKSMLSPLQLIFFLTWLLPIQMGDAKHGWYSLPIPSMSDTGLATFYPERYLKPHAYLTSLFKRCNVILGLDPVRPSHEHGPHQCFQPILSRL